MISEPSGTTCPITYEAGLPGTLAGSDFDTTGVASGKLLKFQTSNSGEIADHTINIKAITPGGTTTTASSTIKWYVITLSVIADPCEPPASTTKAADVSADYDIGSGAKVVNWVDFTYTTTDSSTCVLGYATSSSASAGF